MEALRVLNVDTIRDYHKSYYVPHNICLIVAGRLSTQSLLDVLQTEVEPSIIKHGQAHGPQPEGWKRPFLETPSAKPPVLSETKSEVVEFPETDESTGELSIFFVGPSIHDHLSMKAIDILGIYLTDSAAAPLNKEFIEIASPYW
jgi:Zn-dependent M16 (insulinase) family peptidase